MGCDGVHEQGVSVAHAAAVVLEREPGEGGGIGGRVLGRWDNGIGKGRSLEGMLAAERLRPMGSGMPEWLTGNRGAEGSQRTVCWAWLGTWTGADRVGPIQNPTKN